MAHSAEATVDPIIVDRACEEFGRLLAGRSVNVVEFVGRLLAVVDEVGAVTCRLESVNALRFDWPGGLSIVVPAERAKGKLRAACANLAVRKQTLVGGDCQIFGGSGEIEVPAAMTDERPINLFADWSNTMHKHEFTISRTTPGNGDTSSLAGAQNKE